MERSEKIWLAVVVGGAAVARGDFVRAEGRERAGTYARSLTPSAW
jgi:hypothetical protein